MSIQDKIARLAKEIRTAENTKIQAETRLESLETQYQEVNKEFTDMGIDPKDAVSEKEKIEKEMAKLEEEINALLPHEAIKAYQQS